MSLILVTIRDDKTRQLFCDVFRLHGYRVLEAQNGEQCLETCQQWPVDLVLLDAALDGMDGYETCTRLRKLVQFGQRPVLMLVRAVREDITAALNAGADEFVTWPPHQKTVLDRVERLMDRQMAMQMGQFAWLTTLFEQAQDGMFRSLPDGRYLEVNPALVRMLGYNAKEELYALNIMQHVYADPTERQHIVADLEISGMIQNYELFLKKKDGSRILVSVNLNLIRDEMGNTRHYVGTAREITRTRQMEETLRAIMEVTASVIGTDYFYRLVQALATALHANFAFVAELIAPDTVQTLAFWKKGAVAENFRYALPGSPCETVINRNMVFYPKDVQTLFPGDLGLQDMGIESYFGAPLFSTAGKPLGILVVMHDAELDILALIRPLVQVFADRAGVEIERQQVHRLLKKRQELDLMINSISTTFINLELDDIDTAITAALYAAATQLAANRGYIFLYNAAPENHMALRYHWVDDEQTSPNNFPDGIDITRFPWFYAQLKQQETLTLARLAEAPITDSAERALWAGLRIRSLIVQPLAFSNHPIGFLGFDTQQQEREWTAEDIALVKSIGEVLTNALVRQSAERAERDQRILAEAIANIALELNSGAELKLVLDDILSQLARVIPYDVADIALVEEGVSRVIGSRHTAAGQQLDERLQIQFQVAETENLRRMTKTRKPLMIPDICQDASWIMVKNDAQFHGYLGAPILLDRDVIGFVHLLRHQPGDFIPEEARRLQIFATQIGSAIRNAWLFDSVQHHAIEMEGRVVERTLEVERQRQQIKAILDSISEGVMGALDYDVSTNPPTPRIRYINPAMFRLLGYTVDEWDIYKQRSETVSPEAYERLVQEAGQAVTSKGFWSGETRLRRKDGTEFEAAITLARILTNKKEAIPSQVMIVRDISQEKALAAQKSRFVVSAAHELRTPITNLKTRLYLAKKQPEELDKHLSIIAQVTETMHDLIEKLLDISRFERGVIVLEKELTSVQELVTRVADVQRAEAQHKAITLATCLPEAPLLLDVDVVRINQVLTNLVINAINHTGQGGTITLSARIQGEYAVIDVQDTGTGIKPEHLPHLFEPFYQIEGRSAGLGLGLSITKEIIELHQGEIGIQSVPDQGSCFSVWLPLPPPPPSEPHQRRETVVPVGAQPTSPRS